GEYILYMQLNCVLILFKGPITIWKTETNNKGEGCLLRLQTDGNLVIYDNKSIVIWTNSIYWKNIWKVMALCVSNSGHIILY
ncbi:hypothetical protein SELMODRAFT_19094, partial [Selaginella moellendorffii]